MKRIKLSGSQYIKISLCKKLKEEKVTEQTLKLDSFLKLYVMYI